ALHRGGSELRPYGRKHTELYPEANQLPGDAKPHQPDKRESSPVPSPQQADGADQRKGRNKQEGQEEQGKVGEQKGREWRRVRRRCLHGLGHPGAVEQRMHHDVLQDRHQGSEAGQGNGNPREDGDERGSGLASGHGTSLVWNSRVMVAYPLRLEPEVRPRYRSAAARHTLSRPTFRSQDRYRATYGRAYAGRSWSGGSLTRNGMPSLNHAGVRCLPTSPNCCACSIWMYSCCTMCGTHDSGGRITPQSNNVAPRSMPPPNEW